MRFCTLPRCQSNEPPTADSLLCEPCIERLRVLLRDVEFNVAHLHAVKAVRPEMVPTGGAFESCSPADDHNIVMLDPRTKVNGYHTPDGLYRADRPDDDPNPTLSAPGVLGSWAQQLWEARTSPLLQTMFSGPATIREAVSELILGTTWIAAQDWVLDYAEELAQLNGQLRAAIGDAPPTAVAVCSRKLAGEPCGGDIIPWERTGDEARPGNGGARCVRCRHTYYGFDLIDLRLAQEAS